MRRTRATYLIRASLGEALGRGRQKEKETALCITGVHGVFPGGLIPNWSPLAGPLTAPSIHPAPGPTATGQRCWLALGTVALPKPAPPLCHSSFLGELSLCLESHGGLWKPGTAPSTLPSLFSPSWTRCKWAAPLASCCVLFLLNSHCFLHWDGLKYSSISQRLLGSVPGQRATAGGFTGGAQAAGDRAARMNPPEHQGCLC